MDTTTKIIVADTTHNCEHLLGKFLDESHYDVVINEDTDFYAPPNDLAKTIGEHNVIFKFRKGLFTAEEQKGVYEGLIGAAGESQNRGLAAGPKSAMCGGRDWVTDWQLAVLDALQNPEQRLDGRHPALVLIEEKANFREETPRGLVWLRSKVVKSGEVYEGFFDRWLTNLIQNVPVSEWSAIATTYAKTCISATSYATAVNSGIAGFFDRYPRYPYGRICAYNWKNPELFKLCFPYMRKLNAAFAQLLPERYAAQKAAADKLDKRFRVAEDTVFTTLTVNKTFRTAAHRDAGDLSVGFSNLGVISTGKDFRGGYLVLPQYRVAVNIRPGDLLLINNHEGIHGNTPIEAIDGDEAGIERMSIVAYFREKMQELGSWEYETARRDFVESRRLNQQHPEWRHLWNGVSANLFESDEWAEYLINTGNEQFLEQYHPTLYKKRNETEASLESFFV